MLQSFEQILAVSLLEMPAVRTYSGLTETPGVQAFDKCLIYDQPKSDFTGCP